MTTKSNSFSLQLAAILTIAVLAIGTVQFAAAGDGDIKLEARDGDFKAKQEIKDDGNRNKVDVSAENLVPGEVCTITAKTLDGDFLASVESSTVTALGEINVRHDTNVDKDDVDDLEDDFGALNAQVETITISCPSLDETVVLTLS